MPRISVGSKKGEGAESIKCVFNVLAFIPGGSVKASRRVGHPPSICGKIRSLDAIFTAEVGQAQKPSKSTQQVGDGNARVCAKTSFWSLYVCKKLGGPFTNILRKTAEHSQASNGGRRWVGPAPPHRCKFDKTPIGALLGLQESSNRFRFLQGMFEKPQA